MKKRNEKLKRTLSGGNAVSWTVGMRVLRKTVLQVTHRVQRKVQIHQKKAIRQERVTAVRESRKPVKTDSCKYAGVFDDRHGWK